MLLMRHLTTAVLWRMPKIHRPCHRPCSTNCSSAMDTAEMKRLICMPYAEDPFKSSARSTGLYNVDKGNSAATFRVSLHRV